MTEKFSANIEDLRKYSILICTPFYGGMGQVDYFISLNEARETLRSMGIQVGTFFMKNESLITRARNTCANAFMKETKYTHLLFVDSDVSGWTAKDIVDMLLVYHSDPEKYGLLGGAYPRKVIAWEKIYEMAQRVKSAEELKAYAGDFVINFKVSDETQTYPLNEPVPVMDMGTGFMMISRNVLDKYAETFYDRVYRSDQARTEAYMQEHVMFFNAEIDPEYNRYLSEDYLFCKQCRSFGVDSFIIPWIKLSHTGGHSFTGDFVAMAQANLSMTVDADHIKPRRTQSAQERD